MELEILKESIARILQVYEKEIREESTFAGELGADSIDLAQILQCVEEQLHIRLKVADLNSIETVADALNLIKEARNEEAL